MTLFPEMLDTLRCGGITGRAIKRGLLQLGCVNPRDFATDRHRTVDDRSYGGGPGMVMMVEPLRAAIQAARQRLGSVKPCVIYLSPQGRVLDQAGVLELSRRDGLVLVAGRYEGIDERLIQTEVDEEWSIGDYVLSGGELGAMVMIDAVTRLLPEALGHEDSAQQDSFANGLLDYPHYTRPEVLEDMAVPPVLLSGDHQAIARWRLKQSLGRTWLRRPELLGMQKLDEVQQRLLAEFIEEYEKRSV